MENMLVLANPKTLLSISAEIVSKNVSSQSEDVKLLPLNLKSKLLNLMSKRGILDAISLSSLLSFHELTLDLSESSLDDDCLAAARGCSRLQTLNLNPGKNQAHKFSSQAMLQLFPSLSSLTILYMRRCPAVSDEVIGLISKSCMKLTQLDVGGCNLITDKSLDHIATGLENLTSLNISYTQVSDDGIAILSRGKCRNTLSELLMNECPRITERGVSCIFSNFPSMKYFFFHGCAISVLNVQFVQTHAATPRVVLSADAKANFMDNLLRLLHRILNGSFKERLNGFD
ncbi:hypothetical protein J437_LFUL003058 [Ladona fulva]|uniref:F-box/LRR-repeat protein 15-like leucin rich repeat domain-containing protein n=1 Tax=Ladona fulva TaxID=123851 RepID=A0A8K0K0J5_LADFU|nr:hypothetical protein J437_LFUL003058 [Ladona fulva]